MSNLSKIILSQSASVSSIDFFFPQRVICLKGRVIGVGVVEEGDKDLASVGSLTHQMAAIAGSGPDQA